MAPPRLTRNSASAGAEGSGNDHEADDRVREDLFGKKGDGSSEAEDDDGEGDAGDEDDSESSKEKDEATTEPSVDKKKVANDKRKPQRVDPILKENAKAYVRFNEEHLNGLCPFEERSRGKSTLLRKKTLLHLHNQLKSPTEALADALTKSNDDEEEPKLSFDLFDKYISGEINRFSTAFNLKDLTKDLREKMEEFAEVFIQDALPCVPHRALLPSSELPFNGYLNEAKFTELCAKRPTDMFHEFKLWVTMSMALREQVSEMRQIISSLNAKLHTVHDWVPALEAELANADPAPSTDPKMVQQLKDLLEEKDETIQDLKDTIADLSVLKGIKTKNKGKAKTILPSIEKDPSAAPLRRSTTRFSTVPPADDDDDDDDETPTAPRRARLSTKQADPPKFHNQDKEDDVPFEAWYDLIQDKLEINADHYPTDRDKFLYVKSRLAGYAFKDLMPYLRETHPDQLTTYSSLMTHLWREYSDPNQDEKALVNFTKLKMKDSDNFDFFKNKFVRMAGECQRPKTEWKRELFQRLPAEYKKQMGAKHRDPTISFESYCIDCSGFGQVLKTIAEEAKATSSSRSNKGSGNKGPGSGSGTSNSVPKPGGGGGNRSAAERTEETTRLFNEGRCFLCKERGHTKRDCPQKDQYDRERRDRVAAIVERHLAHENGTGGGKPATPAADEQGN